MPCDIFISYSRRDNAQSRITQLVEHIKADFARFAERELEPFFDQQEINGMKDWRQKMRRVLHELFDARACEICQLDLTHCGGFTAARRIAALADAHRIALAPHNPQGTASTAASLEFGFSQPGYIICETVQNDVPWRQDVDGGRIYYRAKGPPSAAKHAMTSVFLE